MKKNPCAIHVGLKRNFKTCNRAMSCDNDNVILSLSHYHTLWINNSILMR